MEYKAAYLEHNGIQVTVTRSLEDGVRIIFIDGPWDDDDAVEDENGPILRVYLNDEAIWANPKFPEK